MDTVSSLPSGKGNHYQRYIEYASGIIASYDGKEPFHLFLKKYFSSHKKHGSGDRKQITALCYHYFRLGKGIKEDLSLQEKMLAGMFLMTNGSSPILKKLAPAWDQHVDLPVEEKIRMLEEIFDPLKIFPFANKLSPEISKEQFSRSFLLQPELFIRIRPGHSASVLKKLADHAIPFKVPADHSVAFEHTQKLTGILEADKEMVIQDYNSQQIARFFAPVSLPGTHLPIKVWDCCAASGGKSLLAFDFFKDIELTVTDTRKQILDNLRKRFRTAGITRYHSFVEDLTFPVRKKQLNGPFNLVIADVPCSGSGTWQRTPEQLLFFREKDIAHFAALQRKIVSNIAGSVKKKGWLLYITCSVFEKENEENVAFIQDQLGCTLVESGYLKGYHMRADTLFAALFRKDV